MSVSCNMCKWSWFGYSTQYCLSGNNMSFCNYSLVKTSRRAQCCVHGSKLSPLRFCVTSPVSLQKHHCWHSTTLQQACFNEPLSNLSRYDCIYTSSQVYSALYFEMVQLKKNSTWKIFCFRNLSPVAQKSIFNNTCSCVQVARNLCCSLYLMVAPGL